jgi:hypothetical protein
MREGIRGNRSIELCQEVPVPGLQICVNRKNPVGHRRDWQRIIGQGIVRRRLPWRLIMRSRRRMRAFFMTPQKHCFALMTLS